jgi:hypothetical protein
VGVVDPSNIIVGSVDAIATALELTAERVTPQSL